MSDAENIVEGWYFFADPTIDYCCRLRSDIKIPAKFHGPYASRREAYEAWLEWSIERGMRLADDDWNGDD